MTNNTITKTATMDTPLINDMSLMYMVGYTYQNIMMNPDTILKKLLVNDPWIESEFYDRILTDDMVQTCILKRERAVTALKWEVYRGDAEDDVYELVKNAFDYLYHKNMIRTANQNIIRAMDYGRNFLQVDWIYRNNYWVPNILTALPLECIRYDINNKLLVRQLGSLETEPIPDYRVLNPTNLTTLKNKYGDSLLTKCYWPVFFKKNAIQFANVWLERDGMPWVITEYDELMLRQMFPNLVNQANNGFDIDTAVNQVVSFIKNKTGDGILVMPKGFSTRIDNPAKDGNMDNYVKIINLMNDSITRIFTGHSATTTAVPGKLGNDNQVSSDMDSVVNDAKEIIINTWNTLINWITEINFGENVPCPIFQFYEEEDINKDLADRDAILVEKIGVRFNKEYITKNYGIAEEEFEIVEPKQTNNSSEISAELKPVIAKIKEGKLTDINELKDEIITRTGITNANKINSLVKLVWNQYELESVN